HGADQAQRSFMKRRHRSIRDTVLIVVFIEAQFPESTELWELVIQKARGWLEQLCDTEELRILEQIAGDNMQTSSVSVPTIGSSDVSAKPFEPAVGNVNAEVAADKVSENTVKQDAVGDGAQKTRQ